MSWMRKALQVFILGGLFFFSCLSTTAYSAPYPETTALAGTTSQLTIATFNVENLDPRQEDVNKVDGKSKKNVDDDLGSGRFTTLAISIANNLQAPDILALQEVQDNDGAELSSVVNADATAKALIQAIQAAGGPAYEYQDIAPENRKGGGQPGGNIRTAFLFNPQRVKLQELRQLTDLTAFADSRKPLVGEFDFGSSRIAVINNHFASKKGGAAADIQRVQQAEVVKQFVETQLKSDPNANVVVLGDLNDTPDSDALTTLNTAGLHNLVLDVPLPERYSFIFRGNKEQIDHILVSSHLKSAGAEVDAVHINLGTPKGASDHDPALARFIIGGGTSVAVNPIIALSAVLPSVTATSSTDGKIFPGESKRTLIEKLAKEYAPKTSLGYGRARDHVYTQIDNKGGVVTDLYAGYQFQIEQDDPTPRRTATNLQINAEHVWPQSRGAKESAKSDLHNLFPSREEINSDRRNYPFADIVDSETTSWYLDDEELFVKPTRNLDAFSEFKANAFEPREAKKGDIARVMFYFRTVHPDQADTSFFEAQRETLCKWHASDLVDADELARSRAIAKTAQGNENPFVLDASLPERTYCAG